MPGLTYHRPDGPFIGILRQDVHTLLSQDSGIKLLTIFCGDLFKDLQIVYCYNKYVQIIFFLQNLSYNYIIYKYLVDLIIHDTND